YLRCLLAASRSSTVRNEIDLVIAFLDLHRLERNAKVSFNLNADPAVLKLGISDFLLHRVVQILVEPPFLVSSLELKICRGESKTRSIDVLIEFFVRCTDGMENRIMAKMHERLRKISHSSCLISLHHEGKKMVLTAHCGTCRSGNGQKDVRLDSQKPEHDL